MKNWTPELFIWQERIPGRVESQISDQKYQMNSQLVEAIGLDEFLENVEGMYAASIVMSSKDCGSGTCD